MKKFLSLSIAAGLAFCAPLMADGLLGTVWKTQPQGKTNSYSHVKISPCADDAEKLCGVVEWLSEPKYPATKDNGKPDPEAGQPKHDRENPDKSLRGRPLIKLEVLKGFTQKEGTPNVYEGGTVYNPRDGKTYNCRLTHKDGQLDLYGYVGFSAKWSVGRTSTWERVFED